MLGNRPTFETCKLRLAGRPTFSSMNTDCFKEKVKKKNFKYQ